MGEPAVLVNRRGVLKGQMTRILSYTLGERGSLEVNQIKSRKDRLKELFDAFEEVQSSIEEESGVSEDSENYRIEVENVYYKAIANCEKIIKEEELEHSISYPRANSEIQSNSQSNNNANGSQVAPVKLAALQIPKFTGLYSEWATFYDIFTAFVHNNKDISEIQKFFYLREALEGDAEKCLQCLGTTAENYRIAWQTLVSRYNNKKVLIQNHTKALYGLPAVTSESSFQLRQLIDGLNGHINALQMLGQQPKLWGSLLIHLITIKLDKECLREWETVSEKNEISTAEKLLEFLQNRFLVLEAIESSNSDIVQQVSSTVTKRWPNKSTAHVSTNEIKCFNCAGAHTIYRCPSFLALSVNDRIKKIDALKLCKICLRSHPNIKCQSRRCAKCSRPHNSLLHLMKADNLKKKNFATTTSESSTNNTLTEKSNVNVTETASISAHASKVDTCTTVLLATAIVKVYNKDGKSMKCRVLLDTGSQNNFMSEEVCQILKLRRSKISCAIVGIGQSQQESSSVVCATIESLGSNYKSTFEFLVLPKLTVIPLMYIDTSNMNVPKNIQLADPQYYKPQKIDIILGASVFFEVLGTDRIQPVKNGVFFQETHFGYIISGQVPSAKNNPSTSIMSFVACTDMLRLEEKVSRFWQSEEISPEKSYSLEEKLCRQHFDSTVRRQEDGRFTVCLPFRESVTKLGESLDIALRRFLALERKLNANESLKKDYVKFMEEYQSLGHMSPVDSYDTKKHYFLPHHAVIKNDSATTKLRVVFDGTCRTTSNLSLNDVLLKGPVIQEELVTLLARFRTHKYVITADIKQMYRQVLIDEKHRDYQLILWRPSTNEKIQIYRLNTITYGTVPASFLATGCLYKLAEEELINHPGAAEIIQNDFYMDDLLSGANTIQDTIRIRDDVINILRKGGFELRKWAANYPILLEGILGSNSNEKNLIMELDNGPTKILGLIWNPKEDLLQYKVTPYESGSVINKRKILSDIASIYDPLGLIGPIITRAKLFLRTLFCKKYDWDESLPEAIKDEWITYRTNLYSLRQVNIPRSLIIDDGIKEIQVHGFSDASIEAYGACLYLRVTYSTGEVEVRLITAKSRVAPLKALSIPRLELCAAVLLCRLSNKIVKKLKLNISRCYWWTDSTIVIAWISSPSANWNVFVSHRVGEIQELTSAHEWRHVKSDDNPADVISRGRDPSLLRNEKIWWEGPTWLKKVENHWPPMSEVDKKGEVPEMRKTTNLLSTVSNDWSVIERSSSWMKLLRIIAYCLRLRCLKVKNTGPIQTDEITKATQCIVKAVQVQYWSEEIVDLKTKGQVSTKSKIFRLCAFLDQNQILRVGGRLKNTDALDSFQRHPMLIPQSCHISKLIFRNAHEKTMHGGPAAMLAYVRERFWPIHGRNMAKKVFYECVSCFRTKPVTVQPKMGDLPKQRIEPSRPFSVCGIDFAGPFMIKGSLRRNAPITKGYLCVFICFATKAIHLELVCDLSMQAFLNALKRFTSRRGLCSDLYSDNATNFVGANRKLSELKNLFHNEDSMETLQGYFTKLGIRWHFIPPRSPHFGGLWEAAVKSIKTHLYRTVGNANMTYEELNTVVIQVEACLNSRPLCPLSSDPSDLKALTPGHFLTGDSLVAIPEPDVTTTPINRLNRWRRVTQAFQQIWSRWQKEYLAQLQQRGKWESEKGPRVKIGTVVLMKEDNIPPLQWKLGKVVQLHTGPDKVVRVVTLLSAKGQFTRAIRMVCPLPFEGNQAI